MELFDTHCHLDEEAFADDREQVLQRAADAGVRHIVSVGTTVESSRACVALAQQSPLVLAAVGVQPNYVSAALPGDWEQIEQLATDPRVVAIGETGLDRYWDSTPFHLQQQWFVRHIELSQRLGKPFIVHMRECEAEVTEALRSAAERFGTLRGVMHSFTGTIETAEACLELGLYISFAGMLTFKKNHALREVAAAVPAERLLVETDAPYLAPTPHRGKRNEPAFVKHTVACLADVRRMSPEEVAELTSRNARRLFGVGGA
ncbi:MAG: TatD family deoxyribonuclease [Planctomycetota bacterium]|nr:MAG: TatD family deoxyribonuclease [Planctomycetota bacterium]